MKNKLKILSISVVIAFLFSGCSKELEEYNKPAMYWYTKIVESIAGSNLEKADNYFASLQGEHIGSPLLVEATMMLAIAHMNNEEYLLSEHFFNEYIKRFATPSQKESVEFMKIKAKYLALPHPRRDQALIKDAIKEGEMFKQRYPNSMYHHLADTMMTRLYMGEAALNDSIANLYTRVDKYKSAEYYKGLKPQTWIDWEQVELAKSPWYRAWFEGDGRGSWYGFLIPDTKSVVSRNSNIEISEEQ
jgi:outer membrane protein assembly factor BamD